MVQTSGEGTVVGSAAAADSAAPAAISPLPAVVAVVFIASLLIGGIYTGTISGVSGSGKTMTMQEFTDDYDEEAGGFKSLGPSDVVKVTATIYAIEYSEALEDGTTVQFREPEVIYDEEGSVGGVSVLAFPFQGDITGTYSAGDNVILTLHIIQTKDGEGIEGLENVGNGEYLDPSIMVLA